MTDELRGVRVAFVVANKGVEEIELLRPWRAVLDAGGQPDVVAPSRGLIETMHDLDRAERFPVDRDVVVCRRGINTLVTGRGAGDLPAFCRAVTDVFATVPAGALA